MHFQRWQNSQHFIMPTWDQKRFLAKQDGLFAYSYAKKKSALQSKVSIINCPVRFDLYHFIQTSRKNAQIGTQRVFYILHIIYIRRVTSWHLFPTLPNQLKPVYGPFGQSKKQPKGQLISKCLFGVFNFFQKMNENNGFVQKWRHLAIFSYV